MTDLSPYDTGTRCEPKMWQPDQNSVINAMKYNETDDIGKVDFDDDEGHTVCVVHVEPDASGKFVVHVQPLCGDDEISVELHTDKEAR